MEILLAAISIIFAFVVTLFALISVRGRSKDNHEYQKSLPDSNTEQIESESTLPPEVKELEGIVADMSIFNIAELKKNFEQSRRQQGQYFKLMLFFVSVGALVVLTGCILILNQEVDSGVVSASTGIVIEIIAALFFKKEKELSENVASHHDEIIRSQKVLTMIKTSRLIKKSSERDRVIREIIFKVLDIRSTQPSLELDSDGGTV